jgi:hypothetical protein
MYKFIKSACSPGTAALSRQQCRRQRNGQPALLYRGSICNAYDPAVQRQWLWLLLALAVLRLLLSPFIRAGLLHELHQERSRRAWSVLFSRHETLRPAGPLFSLAEWALALLPLYWLLPAMYRHAPVRILDYPLLLTLVPYVLGWLSISFHPQAAAVYAVRLYRRYRHVLFTADLSEGSACTP